MLLRNVGEIQKMRKAPRDRFCAFNRRLSQQLSECVEAFTRLRKSSHALDRFEQILTFDLAKNISEELAQRSNIVSEWGKGI